MSQPTPRLAPYRNPDGIVPEQVNWPELLRRWRVLIEPGMDLDARLGIRDHLARRLAGPRQLALLEAERRPRPLDRVLGRARPHR